MEEKINPPIDTIHMIIKIQINLKGTIRFLIAISLTPAMKRPKKGTKSVINEKIRMEGVNISCNKLLDISPTITSTLISPNIAPHAIANPIITAMLTKLKIKPVTTRMV